MPILALIFSPAGRWLAGLALAFVIGLGLGGAAAHRWYQVDTLKLQASIDKKALADQAATISAYKVAAAQTAALDLAERQRAAFSQSSIDTIQKEADDAAAASTANAAHRPSLCDLTDPEFDSVRKRLP